ncbi:hypothetical protein Ddye_017696 [Dipteronia dyeriana]|uniref:Uncharacterized protein n=1 Tax=Dipteronia dyeriana TaxID=168575 RepID=A0AAD9X1D8_9ROSI|nr:hypothetical protein Ddye_017696 [Dipteronia dyeriana]
MGLPKERFMRLIGIRHAKVRQMVGSELGKLGTRIKLCLQSGYGDLEGMRMLCVEGCLLNAGSQTGKLIKDGFAKIVGNGERAYLWSDIHVEAVEGSFSEMLRSSLLRSQV